MLQTQHVENQLQSFLAATCDTVLCIDNVCDIYSAIIFLHDSSNPTRASKTVEILSPFSYGWIGFVLENKKFSPFFSKL